MLFEKVGNQRIEGLADKLFFALHNFSTTKNWFSGSGRRQLALPLIKAIVGVMEYWNIENTCLME